MPGSCACMPLCAPLGRVGQAGLPGAFWCASPFLWPLSVLAVFPCPLQAGVALFLFVSSLSFSFFFPLVSLAFLLSLPGDHVCPPVFITPFVYFHSPCVFVFVVFPSAVHRALVLCPCPLPPPPPPALLLLFFLSASSFFSACSLLVGYFFFPWGGCCPCLSGVMP